MQRLKSSENNVKDEHPIDNDNPTLLKAQSVPVDVENEETKYQPPIYDGVPEFASEVHS